jgi:hypothetical protein
MTGERKQEGLDSPSELPENDTRDARERPREVGGPKGPEPTRYGDWERAGRCIDF